MDWSKVGTAVAQYAPLASGLLFGSRGDAAAALISDVLGVKNEPDAILEAIKNDPQAVLDLKKFELDNKADLQRMTLAAETKRIEEETKRGETVNSTMLVEYANKDSYVRRVRPTFGYAMIYCMVLMFTTVTGTIIFKGVDAGVKVIIAYASMQWIIVAGLSAFGVYIKKRSDDKAGGGGLGLFGALTKRLAGKQVR